LACGDRDVSEQRRHVARVAKEQHEADDQCAWSPAPFVDGGYGYQYEWSNADSGCVKTK